jgi:hypothetical protein
MGEIGANQLAFAREQYDRSAPIMEGIANSQIAAQNEQIAQARDYYNYQRDTFRPVERGLVADAQRFNTEAYRNQMASQAAADTGRAFGVSQQQNQRAMASMGVNPNSGRFAGMQNASGLQQAAVRANAMTGARQQAEQMGYARRLDAVGMGRGLAGASAAAYGGAIGAGSAAGNSAQSAGQNYMGNMGAAGNTYNAGFNTQMNGLGNILNSQTNMYMQAGQDNAAMIGALAGAGAKAYTSDERLKENIEEVAVDQRTALTIYEFNYIGDTSKRFRGVMAQEVEMSYPDAVTQTKLGFKAVNYELLGIEFKEVSHG